MNKKRPFSRAREIGSAKFCTCFGRLTYHPRLRNQRADFVLPTTYNNKVVRRINVPFQRRRCTRSVGGRIDNIFRASPLPRLFSTICGDYLRRWYSKLKS